VPVHLITREAFRTYFRHLKPDGILAVNITNRYLDLSPVIERAATDFGKVAMVFDYDPTDEYLCYSSSWALVMAPSVRDRVRERDDGRVLSANIHFREWTDDFSNMQRILK
jgi:spermidine synthase